MRYAWPLTGRAEEMRVIETAISDPDVAGIVVCGSAGVGKSRLAREALRNAASHGRETRWAVGTSSARGIPLGAFAAWAPATATQTLQVVRAVTESLTSAPTGTPVVIGVDDVQLLDDLSTFVLHRIVARRAAKLVLTVRAGEPVPAGTRELWSAAPFDRLDLQALSRDETAALLSATLGGRVDSDGASRLWRLTRGNPLYLRNIVEQEAADGRLIQQHGCWRWVGEPVVSCGLVDVVESRIGALPPAVGDVLDVLAVAEPIELAALSRIIDPAAVEEADIRHLIAVERADGRVEARVAHPLYALVRLNRTAPTRLRRMRGLVAAELAKCDDGTDMRLAVRRAALSLDAGLTADAALLVRAAQGAVSLADLELADRLAGAAIRAGAGAEASFLRAHALSWLGRSGEAAAVLAGCPTDGFAAAEHARLTFLRASTMLWALGDLPAAKTLVDDAWPVTPPRSRGCLAAFRAVYWAAAGDPGAAAAAAHDLLLDRLPAVVGAEAAWATTISAGDAGRTTEAVASATAGYPFLARSYDAPQMGFVLADAHVGALLLSGRVEEAWLVAQRLREEAADLPGATRLLSHVVAGRAALGAGRLDTACALLEPVAEMCAATAHAGGGIYYKCLIPYTIACALRGDAAQAAALLQTLEAQRHPSWRCIDHERAFAHAWVAATRGAVRQAIALTLSAAEIARERGQFAAEVVCLQTATQLGHGCAAPRLRDLSALVEGPRVVAAARFAAALHAGDGGELDAVSHEFERVGDGVAAVDAAAHAAVAHRSQGRRGSAHGSAARAETLAQRCGGADTPALRNAIEPLPLTSREREITMLLAEGLTNRAIAERLCLSARTVEAHIYRAMAKTGASDRGQLAAVLPRHRGQLKVQ